jgi:archaellum biogenesis ATPase FlaH
VDNNRLPNQQILKGSITVAADTEETWQPCIKQILDTESSSEAVNQEEDKKEKTSEDVTVKVPRYVISGADLISKQVTEMPTLLQPFLPRVGIAVMAGSSDTGKSAWLRQLVTAVALNMYEFIGYKLNLKHKSAIYVSTEDDENSISYLMQKQNVEGLTPQQFRNLRYMFETEKLSEKLDQELGRLPADLVVIDTLTDVFGAHDFNNAVVVRAFLQQYNKLAIKHNCLIIFNHHLSKAKEHAVPSKNALLGSMAIESKARILLELRKDRFDDSLRHLIPLKGNYLPAEVKQTSVVLKFDENMLFSNTSKTVMIEELAGSRGVNVSAEMKERAAELKQQGESARKIAATLTLEFKTPIGKTVVGEWTKDVVKGTYKECKQEADGVEVGEGDSR